MSSTTETEFSYAVADKRYRGRILRRTDSEPKAAVVLLPDWRGQSPLARNHAEQLVALGCVTVIADLYGDGFSPDSQIRSGRW
jgi:dienelactone hydrolase